MFHNHSHAHSHGHGECTHDHGHSSHSHKGSGFEVEMSHHHGHTIASSLPDTTSTDGSTKTYSPEEFMNVVRFGGKVHIDHLLTNTPILINSQDSQGNSAMHWAAKRGDTEILKYLHEKGARSNIPATTDANLLPIHWAAAEGKIDALCFFLDVGQEINQQDSNGCTPAVIAVQFNQIEAFVYLAKHGADLTLVDHNGDHCLHWAAYKGYEEMLELVLYFVPQELNKSDTFGQSAMHLAAIRGNTNVVDILVRKYRADYLMRDKGGLTALDQTIKKNNTKTEWVLRRRTSSGYLDAIRKTIAASRVNAKYMLIFMLCGTTEKEQGVWMWRITCWSNLYATICSLQFAISPVMADLPLLHVANTFIQVMWWTFFISCLYKDPGFVGDSSHSSSEYNTEKKLALYKIGSNSGNDDSLQKLTAAEHGHQSNSNKSLYEEGLNILARLVPNPTGQAPNLCHTCRVHRPLRSKHCRITGHCVQKFDHFCPYVFNAVGRDNYKFFVGLLFMHPFAFGGFVVASIYYYHRSLVSNWYIAFFVYSIFMFLMVLGLGKYHLDLIRANLTTNEDINKMRYDYLRDERGRFNNPFDLGSAWKNIMDGINPSHQDFYTREEIVKHQQRY